MNIQQIRQKYPQYDKLSDAQLAEALRKKFYPQLGKEDFERRVGLRAAPVETTTLGQVKEFGKGIVPGAVGLVESAAIGASALLPEDMEKSARESIKSVATAAKTPFAASAGYEDSVGRKLGEAVGSTVPFLAAGPLGIAGRLGAAGLGVGAGAGEARTRAEEAEATDEQRSTATALGIIPGAFEVFAPFRILGRLPDAAKADGVALVKRALQAGGEEAAQEAASGFAQNLIARGVYKPEQELIEGLGEQAAYGGATGAIVQGLLDLAIGRRTRGAVQDDTERTALEEQVLAARAARETGAVEREMQGAAPTVPETDLFGEPVVREAPPAPQLGDLYAERAELEQTISTAREEDIAPLQEQMAAIDARIREIGTQPSDDQRGLGLDAARAYEDVVLERARLEQGPQTKEVKARLAELKAQSLRMAEEDIVQRRMAATSAFAQEETVPGAITMEELQGIGKPMRTSKSWFEDNVVGKTPEQVQAMVDADPKLLEGKSARAQVLREILAPKPAEFVEAPSDTTATATDIQPKRSRKRSAAEPSVGTPVEPLAQPDAAGTQAPDAAGVVPSDGPAGAEPSVARAAPPAITEQDAAFDRLARAVQDETSPDYAEAGQVLEANRNNPAFLEKYDAAVRRVQGLPPLEVAQQAPAPLPETPRGMPPRRADAQPATAADAQPVDRTRLEPIGTLPGGVAARGAQQMIEPMSDAEARKLVVARQAQALKESRAQQDAPAQPQDSLTMPLFPEGPKVEVEGPGRGVATEPLTAAVAAQDTRGALQEIADGEGFSPIDRMVAKRLLRNKSLPKIAKDDTLDAPGQYFPKIDTAVLREVDSHTVLHETVHGFVHRLIAAESKGSVQSAGVRKLRAVMQYVAKANPALRDSYGYKNLSEFASEAMSNPEFQAELRKIPYQRTNAFTAFARTVLDMLGIKGTTENNALAESLIAVESVLDTGRAMEVAEAGTDADRMDDAAPAAPEMRRQSKQAMQPAPSNMDEIVRTSELSKGEPNVVVEAMKDLVNAFTKAEGVTFGDRFRTTIVDTGATVETKINKLFDGAVRSAKGMLNPMGLYRQAQDTSKLLLTWFEDGALIKNLITGTYETAVKEGIPSMKNVLDGVKAWGESKGYSFDEALIRVSKMLEARRLDALRKSNAAGTTDFSINKLSLKDARSADAQIDAALADYAANPEIAAIKQQMDTMRFELIDKMVETGRLSAEEGTSWKEATDYVPFDRIEDFATNFRSDKRTGGGIAQLGRLPELVTTKEREVGNVLDNFTKTSGWMLNQIVKQDATKTTLRMLEDMGYAVFKGRNGKSIPTDRRVSSYVKGEQVFYELPSRWDALAFRDMAEPKGAFVRFFSGFSDLLRKTITSMPPFAVRQVVNDIQRAFATSGVQNPYAIILPALRNFATISAAEIMGKRHPSVRQFGRLGITGDYDFNTRNPMDSIMYDLGYKARGPVRGLLHRLDGITRASDLAVRKAIYDQTMKESQDTLLAQTRAREFINFRRRGSGAAMPALTSTIPFFNAYLQGMDVLYRAATGKGASGSVAKAEARRMFASRMATMASFTAIYAFMMSGDDDYEEADLRTRNNNWILPGGFKMPVPEELAAIYKVPVEMALEYFRRNGTPEDMEAAEASITAMKYAFEQYLGRTVPIPAAIKPVIEAVTNHSFFTGQQLEGTFQQELLPSQRVRASSSELAKAIANFTSETFGEGATISPIKIDNFLQGYFGSVSGMLTMATDQLINPDRIDRPLNKYWMLSNFLHDPVGTRRVNEFYELREKVVPKLNTLNELAKTDIDRAEKFMQENEQDLILAQAINGALGQLSDTRAYKNYLNSKVSAESMSMEERKTELEEVRRLETELVGWLREARASVRDQ
jgi:hypothetical protein